MNTSKTTVTDNLSDDRQTSGAALDPSLYRRGVLYVKPSAFISVALSWYITEALTHYFARRDLLCSAAGQSATVNSYSVA